MRHAPTLLLFFIASTASGQPRELYWRSLEVTARLDDAGRLHVRERQEMVFTGDWNGGERRFRLHPSHEIELHGLERQDLPGGVPIALTEGPLSAVDRYDWVDRRTLRWRSRLPSDPPFEETPIAYELDYTYSYVVRPAGDGLYVLEHDFAFSDRFGVIESFSLALTLDDAWEPTRRHEALSGPVQAGPLFPGDGHVVRLELRHRGEGRPEGVLFGASDTVRRRLAVAFGLLAALMGLAFVRREGKLGRFRALVAAESIDRAWLQENLLRLRPEEVGALWDNRTAGPEVAAVIARLVTEGKLESWVTEDRFLLWSRDILHLRRLRPLSAFESGYERNLVSALFVRGDTIDTDGLRDHYRFRGFNPVSRIKKPIETRLRSLFGRRSGRVSVSMLPTVLLLASAAVCLAVSLATRPADRGLILTVLLTALLLYVFGVFVSLRLQRLVHRLWLWGLCLVPFLAGLAYLASIVLFRELIAGTLTLLGLTAYLAALFSSLLNVAKSRDGRERLESRRELAAARRYFARELRRPEPRLEDAWFPYVVAFGLERRANRWLRAFGDEASVSSQPRRSSVSGSGSAASTAYAGWTGGGGRFGGAGASGSWAAAAAVVASGVSRPSSGSSSGGGFSSGGGSSGGGGGGGW